MQYACAQAQNHRGGVARGAACRLPPRLPRRPAQFLFRALPLGAAAKLRGRGFQPGPYPGWAPFPARPQHGCAQGCGVGRRRALVFLTASGFRARLLRPLQQTCLPRPFGSGPTRPSRDRTGEGEKGPASPMRAPKYLSARFGPEPSLGWVSRPGCRPRGTPGKGTPGGKCGLDTF